MSDKKPKIHVFMGAPRVPASLVSVSEAGEQGEEDPPGPWRTMELHWHGEKLRPRTAQSTEKDKEEQYPTTSTTTTEQQPAGRSIIGQEEQFIAAGQVTHVFMGAPPCASAGPASVCEAGEQGEEAPPGPWRTMELCWHGGQLRARAAQSTKANQCTHRTTTVQDVQQDKENQHPTSSSTTTDEQPAGSLIIVQEDDRLITTEEAVLLHAKKAGQSRTAEEEEEEPCSESIHEYLDSCFPLGQPDPVPPNPTERRVSPSLSIPTDFLCSWTHSQALMLRGRHAGQSGHSPDKMAVTSSRKPPTVACSQTPPEHTPQTPPKQTFTPPPHTPSKRTPTPQKYNSSTSPELYSAETSTPTPTPTSTPPCPETPPKRAAPTPASVSSSTPDLYSLEASVQSPRKQASCHPGSMELFSEPMMASLVVEAQGGVILEVTPDGLLCSQQTKGKGVQPERGAGAGTSCGEKRQEEVVVVAVAAVGGGGGDSRAFGLTPPSPPRPRKCLAKSRSPPSTSPDHKRARMSPKVGATETRPEQPAAPVVRSESPSHAGAAVQTSIMLQAPTTLLVRCVSPGVRYSVLVVVVHPCHLKEIQVKRGALAGTSIPLASIVVTDQSGVEMKVVLWRQAAFWALTVYPGDALLITGVGVNRDKWRGETVLQTTYTSRLLNLGQITATSSPPAPQNINGRTLRSLCVFVRERRPLLAALPPHARQNPGGQSLPSGRQNPGQGLPYARLRFLRANTLVHAMLRVSHTHNITAWQSAAEGHWRSAALQKAVLTVEQADGQQGSVVLWGAALDWLPCINRNKDAVWDFRVLLVRDGSTSDLPELHSTPWGSVRPLAPSDTRARDFLRTSSSTSIELDLQTLLSQKYTGDVELRVQIMALQFQGSPSQNAPLQLLDSGASLEQIAETLNGDVTYTGCGRCAVELDTDANGIYCPCYPCLPHTTVRRYFRPAVLTVREADSQLCVQVPAIQLQKMLLNTPPDKLHKTVAPGSEVRHIQLVSERVQALLSPTRRNFLLTVRSHFLCDENSVPMAQDFLLLDFSSQER